MTILQVRAPAEQKSQPLTHESSSVGARPSSAAPVEQKSSFLSTGDEQWVAQFTTRAKRASGTLGFCSTGAAEDGRAPTEERSCVKGLGLLSDRGGRGRTRSDRRAFVCSGLGLLFGGTDLKPVWLQSLLAYERRNRRDQLTLFDWFRNMQLVT